MAIARTFRVNTTNVKASKTLPENVRWMLLRNDGANEIKFNFDDDGANDHFTIPANSSMSSPVHISQGQQFNYISPAGNSKLEVVAWG